MRGGLVARVEPRLRRIEACCVQLSRLAADPWPTVEADPARVAAMERWLEVAIRSAADAGSAPLARRGGQMPETYRGVFSSLADPGDLSEDLASRLQEAAGLRNVLAHGYLERDVSDLQALVAAVDRLLAGG